MMLEKRSVLGYVSTFRLCGDEVIGQKDHLWTGTSYQPLNTWWAEQGVDVHTEFRDGNVPAGYEQLRVLKETLGCLPEGVEKVRLRSDTAGYQHELLRYCEQEDNERFGRIEYAIGSDEQTSLPGLDSTAKALPFPTISLGDKRYKVFGVVTNMDWDGERLIHWHHERCGKSEAAHAIMKSDLAGGKLPSNDFGENAAWWWMMLLALHLNNIMKQLLLGKEWKPKRLKAIRFWLVNLPGRVVEPARRLSVKLSGRHPSFALLLAMRAKILKLKPVPI